MAARSLHAATSNPHDETLPLLRPMSQASVGTLCIFAVAGGLTAGWCLMDSWNHDVSSQLFGLAEVTGLHIEENKANLNHFNAPLLLAFLQFLFMGVLFSSLFFFLVPTAQQDVAEVRQAGGTWTWIALIVTHVFSTFWLQSLIMPRQPMSLGLFAASRSLEVPIAAAIRNKVFDTKPRSRDLVTPVLMFIAAWLLFYSYSQLSQCLCIWSGFGVELTGASLMCIYVLVLAIPSANFVAQESAMTHLRVPPLLLLAGMNLGACLICLPLLLMAHLAGFEDLGAAWHMIQAYPQVYMLILWLCVQMAATCGLAAGLIHTVNSFWAVALRSLRVIFWWIRVLIIFYYTSGADLLSTSLPNESFWSFVMFCGLGIMVGAICAETSTDDTVEEPRSDKPLSRTGSSKATVPAAPATSERV
jgi:hypothetical protein